MNSSTTTALRVWRVGYFLALLLIAGTTALVVHHGLRHGTLWHDSLNFRWRYWTGAYNVLTDGVLHHSPRRYFSFLFGVGWENFGPAYLAHRLVTATEEIRDPHNFIVRTFIELGIVGGALLLIWMLRLWWELTRPVLPGDERNFIAKDVSQSQRSALLAVGSIASIAILVNTVEAIDFSADTSYVVLELMRRVIFLALLIFGLILAATSWSKSMASVERDRQIHFELDIIPSPWILYSILAAIATFLIHNLIEFSLFEPGPLTLFALLTGAALGVRAEGQSETRISPAVKHLVSRPVARVGAGLAIAGWILAAAFVAVPVISAESLARDADGEIVSLFKSGDRTLMAKAAGDLAGAFADVPYNADYARRAAAASRAAGGSDQPAFTRRLLDAAIAADPSSAQNLLLRAQLEFEDLPQVDAALKDFRRATMLDPRNVRMRLDFARHLMQAAVAQHRPSFAADAALEIDRALDDNNQLPAEEIKRLTAEELANANKLKAAAESFPRR